jgi:hypothetical protein
MAKFRDPLADPDLVGSSFHPGSHPVQDAGVSTMGQTRLESTHTIRHQPL